MIICSYVKVNQRRVQINYQITMRQDQEKQPLLDRFDLIWLRLAGGDDNGKP